MCELGYETTAAEMRKRFKLILSDARFRTFVAEIENRVCGMIGTVAYPSYEHNDLSGRILALVTKMRTSFTRRSGTNGVGGDL